MLENINSKERVDASSGQKIVVKLANVFVQIATTLVMVISSFADVIIKLNSNIKLGLLIMLIIYMFLMTIKPIFDALK